MGEDSAEEESLLPDPVKVTNPTGETALPEPVKVTNNGADNNSSPTEDKSDQLQPPGDEEPEKSKDTSSSVNESNDDDMLEIGVSQSEFEELGGNDNSEADKEDEDIEIISEASRSTM